MNRPAAQIRSELPLVSILIPCYNAAAWIAGCIESALGLEYPRTEIIVVDDGSTDESADVIRKYADRITFYPLPNGGANAARNYLTDAARGEWLQYLDADDYLLSGKVTAQIDLLRSLKEAPDVIYSPMIMRDEENPTRGYTVEITDDDEMVNFIRWTPFGTHGLLLRRDSVLGVGGWKVDQPCCQEHELLLRLLMRNARFALSQTAGAVYRKHGSDTISTRDPMRVIRIRMSLTDRLEQHLKSTGRLEDRHKAALFVSRMEAARSAFKWDRATAEQWYRKAVEDGCYWSESSPALPRGYRAAVRLMGFRRTELAATWLRHGTEAPLTARDKAS